MKAYDSVSVSVCAYVCENGEGRKEIERILSATIQAMKERSLSDRAFGRHEE